MVVKPGASHPQQSHLDQNLVYFTYFPFFKWASWWVQTSSICNLAVATWSSKPVAVGNDILIVVADGFVRSVQFLTKLVAPQWLPIWQEWWVVQLSLAAFILAKENFKSSKEVSNFAKEDPRCIIIWEAGAGSKPSLMQGAMSWEPMLKQPLLRGGEGVCSWGNRHQASTAPTERAGVCWPSCPWGWRRTKHLLLIFKPFIVQFLRKKLMTGTSIALWDNLRRFYPQLENGTKATSHPLVVVDGIDFLFVVQRVRQITCQLPDVPTSTMMII